MIVSLNPTYFCNFRCDFCYLTEKQLSDKTKINLDRLDEMLSEIDNIEHIDLYGGEVSVLPKKYLNDMMDVVKKYYKGNVNIITNMSKIIPLFDRDDVDISVSYDSDAREQHMKVLSNTTQILKPVSILMLASRKVIENNVDDFIHIFNAIPNITSVEVKPFSKNQNDCNNVKHSEYENFIIKWLESPIKKNFEFINEYLLGDVINGDYSAFSDNHVYITPNGKYGLLEFDEEDREYFLEVDSLDEVNNWSKKEKLNLPTGCISCRYMGKCLTEHYRHEEREDDSCNGFINLIEAYERMEN